MTSLQQVIPLEQLRMTDVEQVGGKNASLGEMISQLAGAGIRVPGGFATTASAYRAFLDGAGLAARIDERLRVLDTNDVDALARAGAEIRQWIVEAPLPAELEAAITAQYERMMGGQAFPVAVRSSATAEDLPDASFAGQQETFLNIVGLVNILAAIKHVFASLYNDRAISYRVHKGFDHKAIALSAGVQRMVRSDLASSGVMFTLDTESGFRDVVFITAAYGLGEAVVQGAVNPDEFYVHKPMLRAGKQAVIRRGLGAKALKMIFTQTTSAGRSVETVDVPAVERDRFSLTDADVTDLARAALVIEEHYGRPMDIEWGKDGLDGQLYVLQARPETVKSQETRAEGQARYRLKERGAAVLATGRAIGAKIGAGTVRIVPDASQMSRVQDGDVLVTDMTDPNWEPVMKRAAAIITNRGGRTCHAAIIARELGIPAIVGCGNATEVLRDGMIVTASCAEGDTGIVYEGRLEFDVSAQSYDRMPEIPVKIAMNIGNPQLAFTFQALPNAGVGLARLEFVINNNIGVHPKAVIEHPNLPAPLKERVEHAARGYASPRAFFEEKLVEGVATIAAAFWPKPVIVRLSDFKSNEYKKLIGGERYEPDEENPMLGFRGASRYVAADFGECFAMECRAMRRVRNEMGLTNVEIMVPFIRTLGEADRVVKLLGEHGLRRRENGLRLIMMCELPSNAILADDFLRFFDGFSIGSNDLTQLTLGVDRDSGLIAESFDERDKAVKVMLKLAIDACKKRNKYVGICGQGPSDHPDFARWLTAQGISSLSLNPDTVVDTWRSIAEMKPTANPLK